MTTPFTLRVADPGLSPAKAALLHEQYLRRRTARARDLLFRHHFGLAVKVAERYQTDWFALPEAVSAATQGLLEAIDRYDPERGAFSTCAFWWVTKHVLRERAFLKSVVPLPSGVLKKNRDARRLREQFGADDLKVAKELGVSVDELLQLEQVHEEPVATHSSGLPFAETGEEPTPFDELPEHEKMHRALAKALRRLPRRCRIIVMGRHATPPITFAALGRTTRLSREGARKLYLQSMKKLRRIS